ncbi:GA module-containing protein [Myroides injenensis]|uniref:GA module-containing protein n=1 Tax=Myroides injenensis TaxID=1183151 RepID=UPI0002895A95|nr:GA module-containing protein [Myroides injenensis]
MKNNSLSFRSLFSVFLLSFVLMLTSCSSDSNDDIDVSGLSEVKKEAIEKIENATNLTKEEKKDFKNEIADVQDEAVVDVLAKANTYLPVSFKNLEFITVEKNVVIDGKETGWKDVKTLEDDQQTVFQFITNTAIRGKFYIDASRIAEYKHTYDIVIGDKYDYNREKKTVVMTISSLKFTYEITGYNHANKQILLHFIHYNNGNDFPAGIPYFYEGPLKDRYIQHIYTIKMNINELATS